MASELSNYLANKILGWMIGEAMPAAPATVYVGVFSEDPMADGTLTNEVTTTIRTDGRVAIDWSTVAARSINNETAIDFGIAVGGATITHFGLFDSLAAGNMLSWTPADTTSVITAGELVVFPAAGTIFHFN